MEILACLWLYWILLRPRLLRIERALGLEYMSTKDITKELEEDYTRKDKNV